MNNPKARVSMFIQAPPQKVYSAFVELDLLTQFWLNAASGPLRLGVAVKWSFMVKGAEAEATAVVMDRPKRLAWQWNDGATVSITFEPLDGGTVVVVVNEGFAEVGEAASAAALDGTGGFALVLADLKTLLESGTSAGIVRAKAMLIERAAGA